MRNRGFTLIEMLLVMVIIGIIVFASIGYIQRRTAQMRVDRASLQMQQILNAGLAYYVDHGTWPKDITLLYGTYLPSFPSNTFQNPWGIAYSAFPTLDGKLYYVVSRVRLGTGTTQNYPMIYASQLVGTLPLAYTSTDPGDLIAVPPPISKPCKASDTTCYVAAAVNVPGQNLNNATSVTFAGLYHHGGCVPVPTCPLDSTGATLTPQVFVVPVSVSGVNDPNGVDIYGNPYVYPISSFTAYAVPNGVPAAGDTTPPACETPPRVTTNSVTYPAGDDCAAKSGGGTYYLNPSDVKSNSYWRVCLQVVTEKGDVALTPGTSSSNAWGQWVTLMAFTRCAPPKEPAGSTFQVYSN